MQRIAIALLALLVLIPNATFAQPYGQLWLVPATDTGYETTCLFNDDDDTNLCKLAVVLAVNGDYQAVVNFRLTGTVLSWTFLSAESDFTVVGSIDNSASVVFGGCLSAPLQLLTLTYFCPGTAGCANMYLIEGLDGTGITRVDCGDAEIGTTGGGPLTVNGVFGVPPGGFDPDCGCWTVSTKNETWGAIKSLYQ